MRATAHAEEGLMERRHVSLTTETARGIPGLKEAGVPAVFCDAVRVDLSECTLLYISGRLSTDADGAVTGSTMREQTRGVLEGIKRIVEREGGTMDDVVRVRVFVAAIDPAALKEIHGVRSEYWTPGRYPSSTLVQVSGFVRPGALIEIDADAVLARRR
jgi:enamine deaminase RidA (YjgF/YER057c/UK114 family)